MRRQENKRYFYIGFLFLAGILGFAVRWAGIEHITADIEACLIPWSAAMKPGYGAAILTTFEGDYNMPYITVLWLLNYLPGRTIIKVKLFSVLFDYLGAVAAGLIVAHFSEEKKRDIGFTAAFTAVLFYPSAILNGAYWGQCDFVYVAFLLFSVWALLKEHFGAVMILLGCALSFKLQAILILPILLIYWWKKRSFSAVYFLLVPVIMEVLCIPAIMGGSSVFIPFSVYLRQLGRYPFMYVYYPNFWALFKEAPYYIFSNVAILSIIAGLGVFAVAVIRKRTETAEKQWMEFMVWSVFFMMCFLPCMHERYGMFLEVSAIIYAFLNRKTWWNAVILGAGSYIAYLQVTFGKHILPDTWIAVAYLAAFGFFTWQMVKNWNNQEEAVFFGARSKGPGKKKIFGWSGGLSEPEKKVMDYINRYVIGLAFLILTVLAVLVRKPMIECISPDYLPNLIEIEGNYHTPFYMFLMYMVSKSCEALGKTLFFGVKLVCVGADILAAGTLAVCVYDYGKRKSMEKDLLLAALVVYAAMLFLPMVLLNSSFWGHWDSISIALLAVGYLLYNREGELLAGVLAGLACGLLMHNLVWLFILAAVAVTGSREKEERQKVFRFSLICAAVILLSSITGLFCGYGLWQSLIKLVCFPLGMGSWVLYLGMVFVLLMGVFDYRYLPVAVLLEVAAVLDWGEFLYDMPVLPKPVFVLFYLMAAIWFAVCLKDNKKS